MNRIRVTGGGGERGEKKEFKIKKSWGRSRGKKKCVER